MPARDRPATERAAAVGASGAARPARRSPRRRDGSPPSATEARILDVAASSFGTRGYEATSLDAIAGELGLAKQSVLYWFPSKPALLDAVLARAARELSAALDDALVAAGDQGDRVEVVMRTVFRFAVRRPALLGLLREASRVGPDAAGGLAQGLEPMVARAVAALGAAMDAGTIRRADPRATLLFCYSTVVGVATELEAHRALGLEAGVASLSRLRRELFTFLRAALAPG